MAKREKKPKTSKVRTSEPKGITSLVATPTTERDEVQHIMNNISLYDAKRLYSILCTYFGTP